MRDIVKFLDRKLLIVIGVVIVATLGVRMLVLSSAKDELAAAKADRELAADELEQIEARVERIRAQGSENLQDVVTKVAAIEQQLPPAADELTLTVAFDNLASASGAELREFAVAPQLKTSTTDGGGILTAQGYTFVIHGSYDAAIDFLERVLAAPTFLATFDSIELRPSAESGSSSADGVLLFEQQVTISGAVMLWSLNDAPAVGGAGGAAPTETSAP